MAATGYTPISLYYSTTAAAVPVNSNLVNGELAINITDGKLYYKDNAGVVKLLASNATSAPVTSFSAGTTGFTPSTSTTGAITLAGTLATTNGGTGLTSFTSGGAVYATSTSVLTTGTLPTTAGGTNLTSFTSGGAVYATSTSALTTGTLPIASGGTGATTLAGANIAVTNAANTFTATQTLSGTTATAALKINNITELANIVGAAPASTQTFYVNSGAVQYYTTNAANNWTVNFGFSSGTTLNTAMSVGDSISCTMLTTQGSTAYYNSSVQVDGTTSGVTTKWQGGTAPTSGNASSIDSYTYVIIKTASATFTVLASLTKFA